MVVLYMFHHRMQKVFYVTYKYRLSKPAQQMYPIFNMYL